MNVYVDSSVLLRLVFGAANRLPAWSRIDRAVSSEMIRVESFRTIDRARLRGDLTDSDVALRRSAILEQLEGFDVVALTRPILERASEPFATSVGTLDALHLATAVLARERIEDLKLATHDQELATAARASGFDVLGT